MSHFVCRRRVEFHETDMAGIVHFSNFFKYMEQAEHEMFRHLGLEIHGCLPDGTVYGWPRVHAECNYQQPAAYGDWLEIAVTISRRGGRSLTTEYMVSRDGTLLATGTLKTVYCVAAAQGGAECSEKPRMQSAPIPADVANRLDSLTDREITGN